VKSGAQLPFAVPLYRGERMLIEQLQYNLLFRWFVGMEMDEEVRYSARIVSVC
jgi:transposase